MQKVIGSSPLSSTHLSRNFARSCGFFFALTASCLAQSARDDLGKLVFIQRFVGQQVIGD